MSKKKKVLSDEEKRKSEELMLIFFNRSPTVQKEKSIDTDKKSLDIFLENIFRKNEDPIQGSVQAKIEQNEGASKEIEKKELKTKKIIFLSYSTLDSTQFQIPKVAKSLKTYPSILKVLYWESSSGENIVRFMERALRRADVFILFCSENAKKSKAITGEWEAAYQMERKGSVKIISVYEKEDSIPVLLLPLSKMKYSKDSFEEFIERLYQEIFLITSSKNEKNNVFLSYSTLDSEYFNIPKISKQLETFPEIGDVLLWELDSSENVVEYMERNLRKSKTFVLFCSKNALDSKSVEGEWMAAYQLRDLGLLRIISVFEDEDDIPLLLTPSSKVKFMRDNFKIFIENLYKEIIIKGHNLSK